MIIGCCDTLIARLIQSVVYTVVYNNMYIYIYIYITTNLRNQRFPECLKQTSSYSRLGQVREYLVILPRDSGEYLVPQIRCKHMCIHLIMRDFSSFDIMVLHFKIYRHVFPGLIYLNLKFPKIPLKLKEFESVMYNNTLRKKN